jgi:hypothetical protein
VTVSRQSFHRASRGIHWLLQIPKNVFSDTKYPVSPLLYTSSANKDHSEHSDSSLLLAGQSVTIDAMSAPDKSYKPPSFDETDDEDNQAGPSTPKKDKQKQKTGTPAKTSERVDYFLSLDMAELEPMVFEEYRKNKMTQDVIQWHNKFGWDKMQVRLYLCGMQT